MDGKRNLKRKSRHTVSWRRFKGIYIPHFLGEALYDGSPAIVLSEIVGKTLKDLETPPEGDEELRAKLLDTFRVFTKYGITYTDPRLDNMILAGSRIMAVDLEQVQFGTSQTWEGSENHANACALMYDIKDRRNPGPLDISCYFPHPSLEPDPLRRAGPLVPKDGSGEESG